MPKPTAGLLSFLTLFCVFIFLYAIFSFSLTDPNLVILKWEPFWNFQQYMWHTFFDHAAVLTQAYGALITGLFVTYFGILTFLKKQPQHLPLRWQHLLVVLLIAAPLFLSSNALSHDVFNYMFNAKMILVYEADPAQVTAITFSDDVWLRFMHNIHTTAPYGPLWNKIALVPYILGGGKFLPTWLLFRVWSVMSFSWLFAAYLLDSKERKDVSLVKYAVVLLNPLVLIEVISNSHNDLWMMAPAVMAFVLATKRKSSWWMLALSGLLLVISIQTKLATVLLVPLWLFVLLFQLKVFARMHQMLIKINKKVGEIFASLVHFGQTYWAELAVLAMLIPLTTSRSQQFHPWYLTWLFVWIPFLKWKWVKWSLIVLSISSLFRYVPWMLAGGYNDGVILQQKMITWIPFLTAAVIFLVIDLKSLLNRR